MGPLYVPYTDDGRKSRVHICGMLKSVWNFLSDTTLNALFPLSGQSEVVSK